MSKVSAFFKKLGAEIVLLFGKNFPTNWEPVTEGIINFFNQAKTIAANPFVVAAASMIPDGTVALDIVIGAINTILPELEIAQGCEEACAGITNPVQKADAILAYIIANINKLPAKWQGKHWEDVAVAIMKEILQVTTTEAKALLNVKYGQLTANS